MSKTYPYPYVDLAGENVPVDVRVSVEDVWTVFPDLEDRHFADDWCNPGGAKYEKGKIAWAEQVERAAQYKRDRDAYNNLTGGGE